MANHAQAKFSRALDAKTVAFFMQFVSDRDFAGALRCEEVDNELTFEPTVASAYWDEFASQMVIFMADANKTVELRHQHCSNNTMKWARTWLQSACAGALGAKVYKDDGVGPMSFVMHTGKSTTSAYHYLGGMFPKWLRALRKSEVSDLVTIPAVQQSRLLLKDPVRLNNIGDGFITWASTKLETIEMNKFDLAHIGVSDSTHGLPSEWLQGLSSKQLHTLFLHAVRNRKSSDQQLLATKMTGLPPVEKVRSYLQKLPEIKYTDTPYDVFDREKWFRAEKLESHTKDTHERYKSLLAAKSEEYVGLCIDLMQASLATRDLSTAHPDILSNNR